MHKVYKNQYFTLFQCHLLCAMYVFCYNSKFISIQFIFEKGLSYFPLPLPSIYKLLNPRKQISLQFYQLAKCTYFTRSFGYGQFSMQPIKFAANNIMSSSYDFMQCDRSPYTISVSIHNIQFSFKHDNKIL